MSAKHISEGTASNSVTKTFLQIAPYTTWEIYMYQMIEKDRKKIVNSIIWMGFILSEENAMHDRRLLHLDMRAAKKIPNLLTD